MSQDNPDIKVIRGYLEELRKHFDTVQILCIRVEGNEMVRACMRAEGEDTRFEVRREPAL